MIQSKQVFKKTLTVQCNEKGLSPIRSNKTPIAKNYNQPNDRCLSPFRRSPTPTKLSNNRFNRTPNKSSKSPLNRTPTKTKQTNFKLQYLSGKPQASPQPQSNSNSKLFNKLMSNIGKNAHSNTDKKQNINVFSLLSGDPAFMRSTVNPDYYNSKATQGNSCFKQKSIKMPSFTALINNIDASQNANCSSRNRIQQTTGNIKKVPNLNVGEKNYSNQNSILSKLRKNTNSHRPVLQQMSEQPQLIRRGSQIIPDILQKPENAFKYFSVMHQIHGETETYEQLSLKDNQHKFANLCKGQSAKSKIIQPRTEQKKLKPLQSIQQDFSDVMFLLNKVQQPDQKNQSRNKITDVNISNSLSNSQSLNMDF